MIRQITPDHAISAYLDDTLLKAEKRMIDVLSYVGVECVNEARNNGSYLDQTGNLRSSVGFVVLRDGQVVRGSQFEVVKQGYKGRKEGRSFVSELKGKYSKGLVLIVVAGMNYAAYVETKRNVLESSQQLAEIKVPEMLGQIGFKVR